MKTKAKKPTYDCTRCVPSWCCAYPLIAVTSKDIKRLAKGFGMTEEEVKSKHLRRVKDEKQWHLRQRQNEYRGKICKFYIDNKCSVYEHRPDVCREFPYKERCHYYDFLEAERKHQDDENIVVSTETFFAPEEE